MVTVTGTLGSAPREAGARMIVAQGRLAWGTIGGGNLEKLAIERASEALRVGGAQAQAFDVPLAESAGQCCGGKVALFLETFPWRRPQIVVFGAGHVGQAIGGLAPWLGTDVVLIDSRDEATLEPTLAEERPYELRFLDAPESEVAELAPGSLVLILTHSHALDLEILNAALDRADLAYVGLIGSERKWARFQQRLLQRGRSAAELARVTCPIGIGRISKEPRAIALSVAAQLVEVLGRSEAANQPAG